jgi:hypothetical protein
MMKQQLMLQACRAHKEGGGVLRDQCAHARREEGGTAAAKNQRPPGAPMRMRRCKGKTDAMQTKKRSEQVC